MRLKCERCGKPIIITKGAWYKRLSPVVVCGKCYELLAAADAELNIKDTDYAGASTDVPDALKTIFGMT
jgi:hypothetical protein